MKSRKTIFIRLAALAVVIAVAAVMFVIGRGHTVYFDNKSLTAEDGTVYEPPYQIEVFVNDQSVGKLKSGERGMTSVMGQKLSFTVHVQMKKDSKKAAGSATVDIPYDLDGIILNLPAMLNGADEDVYMEEFIPAPPAEDADEEVIVTDEFAMPTDE